MAFGDTVCVQRCEKGLVEVEVSRGQTLNDAATSFEKEMIMRAKEKVERSREAAYLLHNLKALQKVM